MADDSLEALRGYAFAVAYRMLGSVTDAEDVVQEGLLRPHRAEGAGSTAGPGPAAEPGPAERAELADSLSVAMMVLLESLSPEQRAAFLLHDVFGYSYREVAEVVNRTEPTARQLTARARKAVEARRPRFEASRQRRDELADRFFAAAFGGEVEQLEAVLAEDVRLHGDGGGKVPAIARPLQGAGRVARALSKWGRIGRTVGARVERAEVNGQPGALLRDGDGRIISAMALEIVDGRVEDVYSIVNPDKIGHLGEVADFKAMMRNRPR